MHAVRLPSHIHPSIVWCTVWRRVLDSKEWGLKCKQGASAKVACLHEGSTESKDSSCHC